jgi:uncharacterized protein (DUF2384 family)
MVGPIKLPSSYPGTCLSPETKWYAEQSLFGYNLIENKGYKRRKSTLARRRKEKSTKLI